MEIAAYRQPSVLRRKRALAGCEAFDIKKEAAFAVGDMPNTEIVRQRFQTELIAVRRLLEKAAAVPVPRSEEPPAKRSKKASTSPAVARKMMAVEEEEEEDVDIVGGVSPLAIAPAPLQLAEDEDEDEDVDICGGASPVVMPKNLGDDAGSPSSSSSSDSDSDSSSDSSSSSSSNSDSDSDESVDSPAPAERAATPSRTVLNRQIQERDAELIIARANKEFLERQRMGVREKARQEVLETERTAMPSDTVHWTVLKSLHIVEYNMARPDSLLRQLGLFLKADHDQQQQQQHRQSFQEELEEGEIRL